jgi:hypothetical protein
MIVRYTLHAILAFLVMAVITEIVRADTEPNDSPAQANVLAPNGTSSGSLNSNTDGVDWWKVTLPSDGALIVSTLSDAALEIDNYMYDQDGKAYLAGYLHGGVNRADTTQYFNLLAGTYYIRSLCYGGSGAYTIGAKFIPTQYQNDAEGNDSVKAAIAFALNGSSTGHLGFYGNGYTDLADWRKIVTTADGKLVIATYSDPTIEIDNAIYDANQSTMLASYKYGGAHREDTSEVANLVAGTYYVRTLCYGGYGSYTITNQLTPTAMANDQEQNDSVSVALAFPLNTSTTGHLGFYRAGYSDAADWRQVVTTADGKLVIATYSDPTIEIDNYIFDQDKKTILASYKYGGAHREDTSEFVNLQQGTYYVKTLCYGGYGSYTITNVLTPAKLANDAEPNGTQDQALPIALDTRKSGHLGYYSLGVTDVDDYYTITLSQAVDTLFIRTDSSPELEIDLRLLNAGGQTLTVGSTWGVTEMMVYPKAAAGTYAVHVKDYNGYGSYNIIASAVRPGSQPLPVEQSVTIIPSEFSLSQNFPNPFNPSTRIRFALPSAHDVTVTVHDVLGREVGRLVDEMKPAGEYEIEWNAAAFPSGMYVCRMQAGSYSAVKKLLLQK